MRRDMSVPGKSDPPGYTDDWRGPANIVGAAVWTRAGYLDAHLRCTCTWRIAFCIRPDEEGLVAYEAELHLEFWHDESLLPEERFKLPGLGNVA